MNHRLLRVRELIKRELSTILERNYTFPGSLVTIHDVDVTPDLRQCFIYVGILGNAATPYEIINKLRESRGPIQRELYKRVKLRNSPSLMFKYDDSVERGVRVLNAIENLPEPLPDLEEEEQGDEGQEDTTPENKNN